MTGQVVTELSNIYFISQRNSYEIAFLAADKIGLSPCRTHCVDIGLQRHVFLILEALSFLRTLLQDQER